MTSRDDPVQPLRTGIQFVLWIIFSFYAARYVAITGLPLRAAALFFGLIIFLITAPLSYYLLNRRWRHTNDFPYLAFQLDFLLPFSLYPALFLVSFAVLPRYGLWAYGARTVATVASVRTVSGAVISAPGTCVDYVYEVESERFEKAACSGSFPFVETPPDDALPVTYIPSAPWLAVLELPPLFRRLDRLVVWWALIVVGWLVGTAVASATRYEPPSPPPPKTPLERLQRYDLDQVLSAEDDPALWSAVIASHFDLPESDKIVVPGLRFGIGTIHPTSKFLLQPILGTCFSRVDPYHLTLCDCPQDERGDHDFDPELVPSLAMRLIYVGYPPLPERPTLSIVVPRPSANLFKVPVYTAVNRSGAAATGATLYWVKDKNGRWQKSSERVNWWYEG